MAAVKYGDWAQFSRWLRKVKSREFAKNYRSQMTAFGKHTRDNIRGHIILQDLDWVPLSDATITKKGHDEVYMETESYFKSISIEVKTQPGSMDVVIFPEGKHGPSGLPMAMLAGYLEYGTETIPSRPLWRPTVHELVNSKWFSKFVKDLSVEVDFTV